MTWERVLMPRQIQLRSLCRGHALRPSPRPRAIFFSRQILRRPYARHIELLRRSGRRWVGPPLRTPLRDEDGQHPNEQWTALLSQHDHLSSFFFLPLAKIHPLLYSVVICTLE